MRRVRLLPGWAIYVNDAHVGPGEVVEVADDHAEHLVERGVAVLEARRAKARPRT